MYRRLNLLGVGGRSTDGGGEVRPELLPFPDGVYAACCVNDGVCMSVLSPGCRSTRRAKGGARDVVSLTRDSRFDRSGRGPR